MAKKPRKIKSRVVNRKKTGDLKKVNGGQKSDISESLPQGHRFDKEIANIAYALLVEAYLNAQESKTGIEKLLRKSLLKRIESRRMSKLATRHFSSILDIAREMPLAVVLKKIMEVTWDEYNIISKHMKNFDGITFKQRFDNFLLELTRLNWKINEIECGFKGTFSNQDSFIIIDKDYLKFFNEDGSFAKTFNIGAKSSGSIHEMTEAAYKFGLISHKNEVINGLYGLTFYPDNNIPGPAFSPPSVTDISYERQP